MRDAFIGIGNQVSLRGTHKRLKEVVFKWLKLVMHVYQHKIKVLMDRLIHLRNMVVNVSLARKRVVAKRTELDKYLDYLREGDILVIYKLDRLGRTTKQLIELSQWLDDNSIDLHIIDMNVSTKDAMGKMFFTMMSAFAELEANLLSERTKKGLEAARARGRKGGRPSLPDHKKREIKFLYDEQKLTGEEIAKQTGVSRSTVYRMLKD